ncbi:hypothetical protein [Pedobacter cryoconitis]|uniref:Uncharacterized protein n=1 Tax=Pedobacter cryoconitis TaxID=188932 RepID=A0A327S5B0_9SPHI|nr:hypothetical protein [Pedobacter cryoconitis]RAJ20897.1 hypothetical protein LY11_05099 [Pedobacter cryoconitis]
MEDYSFLHQTNIIVHIVAGSIALILGLIAILTIKGGRNHRKSGLVFLFFLAIVIATGLIGVFIFGRNTFLLVITMLSGYLGFSGYRILKFKSNKLYVMDIAVAVITLLTVCYFIYYFKSIGLIWSPVIIYSTVGYLLLIIVYDFIRYLIPVNKYGNLWMYEHILKMMSAFSGILSAFTGTVFPQYQPYSQFLPSMLGTVIAVGFMIYIYRKRSGMMLRRNP